MAKKKHKKWRLSDVFSALAEEHAQQGRVKPSDRAHEVAREASARRPRLGVSLTDGTVGAWLDTWVFCAPVALGVEPWRWAYMTNDERCDVVVAHARRLRVPRRA